MNGTFKATIIDHVLAESGDKKTPSVKFKLHVTKNLLEDIAIDTVMYHDVWLTEAAIERAIETLTKAVGWTGADLSDFNGTGKFNGVDVSIVVADEEYKGKAIPKVKFMNNINSVSNVKPIDRSASVSLSERMKGKVLAYRQANPVPPQTPKAPEDKLPF